MGLADDKRGEGKSGIGARTEPPLGASARGSLWCRSFSAEDDRPQSHAANVAHRQRIPLQPSARDLVQPPSTAGESRTPRVSWSLGGARSV